MHVFIDESGDPGLRVERPGTSPFFVVAAVIVADEPSRSACESGLHAFRESIGARRAEFKFNKCSDKIRLEYLRWAARLPWTYAAAVVHKGRLRPADNSRVTDVQQLATRRLLERIAPSLHNATVVFDVSGSREFRSAMAALCRDVPPGPDGARAIRHVQALGSHTNAALQLADMVAGATARSLRPGASGAMNFSAIIATRCTGVLHWPP